MNDKYRFESLLLESSFGIDDCDCEVKGNCTDCTTCIICSDNIGKTLKARFEQTNDGRIFYFHENCMTCSVCQSRRSIYIIDSFIRSQCNCTSGCKNCPGPFCAIYRNSPVYIWNEEKKETELYHAKCKSFNLNCLVCHEDSSRDSPFLYQNGSSFHKNCKVEKCVFCGSYTAHDKAIKIVPNGSYSHSECLENKWCNKCHSGITANEIRMEGDFVYHSSGCNPDKCTICERIIGDSESLQIGGKVVHDYCCKHAHCPVCYQAISCSDVSLLNLTGKQILHVSCEPIQCDGCSQQFKLAQPVNKFKGKRYHDDCIPSCFICKTTGEQLEPYGNSYVCSVCDLRLCILCGYFIGRDQETLLGNFPVHQHCRTLCHCNGILVDPENFPTRTFSLHETPLYMPVKLKKQLFALIRSNRRTKSIDKDSFNIILNIIFNSDPKTLKAVPIRHGLDFSKVCTILGCKKSKCKICGEYYSHTILNPNGCVYFSCCKIYELYIHTMRHCFPNFEISERQRDNLVVKELHELFIQNRFKMSQEQLSLFSANTSCIGMLYSVSKEFN